MYESAVFAILSAIVLIHIVLGLNCGIQSLKEENEQLQNVAVKCIKNYKSTYVVETSDNSTNGTKLTINRQQDTEELEDQTYFAPARGLKRSKRTPQTPNPPPPSTTATINANSTIVIKGANGTILTVNNTSTNATLMGVNGNIPGVGVNGNTVQGVPYVVGHDAPIIIDECTVKCFLQKMEMLHNKGYPDHTKMSDGFRDKFKGKELQDFVQDTMDECFFFMDKLEGDRLDACGYAGKLAVCLAEKARINCEDWPVGNLPIPLPMS